VTDNLTNSKKWKLELAVLLLPAEYFYSYLYELHPDAQLDKLDFTEGNRTKIIQLLRFVLKILFNFLLQPGLQITPQEF